MATTSGSYNFADTTANVVFDAASKLGFLGEGDVLSPSETQLMIRSANRLLKGIAADSHINGSIKMWQRQQGYLFLQANSGTYTLSSTQGYWCNNFVTVSSNGNNAPGATVINVSFNAANTSQLAANLSVGLMLDDGNVQWTTIQTVNSLANTITVANGISQSMNNSSDIVYVVTDGPSQPPQMIEAAVLRDINGNDVPINHKLLLEEYAYLPSKTASGFAGDPIAFYFEPHLIGPAGFAYIKTDVAQAQDTSKYIVINYIREIKDLVNPNDLIELPSEWYRAFIYELAYDVSDDFDVEWSQSKEAKRVEAVRAATKNNKMNSTMGFSPGNRGAMWNLGNGFYSR